MYSVFSHSDTLTKLKCNFKIYFSYRLCIFMCAYMCTSRAQMPMETTGRWDSWNGQLYASPHGY